MTPATVPPAVRNQPPVWCARCDRPLTDVLAKCVASEDIDTWVNLRPKATEGTRAWRRADLHRIGGALVRMLVRERGGPNIDEEEAEADRSLADTIFNLVTAFRTLAVQLEADEALGPALAARNAAIEGDAATVDEFSRTWLGLSDPARWREAVEMALLGDWTASLGRGWTSDPEIVDLLDRHTRAEHRHLQPLWERKTSGRRSVLLSQPIGNDLALADLLTDRCTPEHQVLAAELTDSRLAVVLRQLAAEEAATAHRWAVGADSWAQAAQEIGLPTAYGERVRRKLKRLGWRHTERAAAMAVAR